MSIKKSRFRKASATVGGLTLLSMSALVIGAVALAYNSAEAACGDGVCDTTSENNDLCPDDCQCIDNGIVDPSEGCGCKDMICTGETSASACGTFAGPNGECPGDLVEFSGVCWSRCECQGICSEDDEAAVQSDGGGGDADPCETYLICDGGYHPHPVSRGDTWNEVLRIYHLDCIQNASVNPGNYMCLFW